MNGEYIAFEYANDVWIVSRDGGNARRLTSFQGAEIAPSIRIRHSNLPAA
jgi:tricorn protease